MVQTPHRLGYRYKKTTIVPGKMDREKQKGFAAMYEKRYKCLWDKEKVYFMDGSHPTQNSHAGYGWIAAGKRFGIKSPTGRMRMNLMGAYDPKTGEIIVKE